MLACISTGIWISPIQPTPQAPTKPLPATGYAVSQSEEQPMTKEDLVALADALRIHNRTADGHTEFTPDHLRVLADFCASQFPTFNWERWIDHISGVNTWSAEGSGRPGQQG